MLITTGKVSGGLIEIESGSLPEGVKVTILAPENGETFEIDSDGETSLLAALAEAERGEAIDPAELFKQIRTS